MRKVYYLCSIFLALILVGSVVLSVHVYNTNITDDSANLSTVENSPHMDIVKEDSYKNNYGSDPAVPYVNNISNSADNNSAHTSKETSPDDNSQTEITPAKGHFEERGPYWDPWIEQWMSIWVWVPD